METQRTIAKTYVKVKLGEQKSDFEYWQTQPVEKRLETLEQIRSEYHAWKNDTQPGFQRFFQLLNANDVRYLIVGGYAVAYHGHPRYTKDIDVWIWVDPENARRVVKTLADFGFESLGLKEDDFLETDTIIQLGYAPNRIDLIIGMPGVDFGECYEKRSETEIEGVKLPFIDLENLKKAKKASGRPQDLADVENLK